MGGNIGPAARKASIPQVIHCKRYEGQERLRKAIMPSSTALFVLFHICGLPSIFLKDHSVIEAGLALIVKGACGIHHFEGA